MVERKSRKQWKLVFLLLVGMMLSPLNSEARDHLLAIGEVGSVQQSEDPLAGLWSTVTTTPSQV